MMKPIFILLIALVGIVSAQNSEGFFTLKNGQKFQGNITEINDTYLLVNGTEAVLYKVLSSLELKNQETINTIVKYLPDITISEKADSLYLLTFENIVYDKTPEVTSDSNRVPFYDHHTNISAGLFINTNEKAFGFTLKGGYSTMISKGLALGGYLAFNEWSPRVNTDSDTPKMSSSVSTMIELMPIIHLLPAEFGYKTSFYFQAGAGYTISSSSAFVLENDSDAEATSTSRSNLGGVSALFGIGSFDQIKFLGWISLSLNYHLGYLQKDFSHYVSLEFGIYL